MNILKNIDFFYFIVFNKKTPVFAVFSRKYRLYQWHGFYPKNGILLTLL